MDYHEYVIHRQPSARIKLEHGGSHLVVSYNPVENGKTYYGFRLGWGNTEEEAWMRATITILEIDLMK